MNNAYRALKKALSGGAVEPWVDEIVQRATGVLGNSDHGDLPAWLSTIKALPEVGSFVELDRAAPRLGLPVADLEGLQRALMKFHPWRKGPLELGGVVIDSEWRSDWKWARVAPHVDLRGHNVFDVGCGNGYFGWRMIGAGANCVIGIDPTAVFVMQWLAQKHFAGNIDNYVLPLADTDLPAGLSGFDIVFSMGVLYHRRQPEDHLQKLKACLAPGGQLVLETLVLDPTGADCLVPDGRYARMGNVWFIPTAGLLEKELLLNGFEDVHVVDITTTGIDEQRSTQWMRFESLEHCLDPVNPGLTVEGYPAPVRAVVVARAP